MSVLRQNDDTRLRLLSECRANRTGARFIFDVCLKAIEIARGGARGNDVRLKRAELGSECGLKSLPFGARFGLAAEGAELNAEACCRRGGGN